MEPIALLADVILLLYGSVLVWLGAFGLHRLYLAWASASEPRHPAITVVQEPKVTVQLPLYNEREVAARVIDACSRLDWPAEKLQIQVLDDSTDDTRQRVDDAAERARARGVRVDVVRRTNRVGFKAGALEEGLNTAVGDVIAIFDADFVPPPDFLRTAVPYLGPGVGVVQTRWTHLNAEENWLTAVQATLLDGHFILEHGGRWRRGCWFNFNGTAGIWRRAAIEEAGGWQHDTLTEDLDLSYRAQLAGWRFVYRNELLAPAELPSSLRAFKAQQHRWARGGVQTGRKLWSKVWAADLEWRVRREALFHLISNVGYPLTVLLTLLLPLVPVARAFSSVRVPLAVDLLVFVSCVFPLLFAYYAAIRRSGGGDVGRRIRQIPLVVAVGAGICLAQTRAVVLGLVGPVGEFERTPKKGDGVVLPYAVRTHGWAILELLFAAWQVAGFIAAVLLQSWGTLPFLALFGGGFALVGLTSLREARSHNAGGSQVANQSQGPSDQAPVASSTVSNTR